MKKFFIAGFVLTSFLTNQENNVLRHKGAIIRGDANQKTIAIVFTGHEYADGADIIIRTLKARDVKASFFFTGEFYRNPEFKNIISRLNHNGHYLGAHSDKHLLYCDWSNRDSLLLTKEEFLKDLQDNYREMKSHGIQKDSARFFLPPYEWYNDSIASWTRDYGLQLINFTPGTRSNADYTTPAMKNYVGSEEILQSILTYEQIHPHGLNGFILLLHIGTDAKRKDKMYNVLGSLLDVLEEKNYTFVRIDELLRDVRD